MAMRKTVEELATDLTTAIKNYVKVEILEATQFSDHDSMGSWHEERALEETLADLITRLTP